MTTGNDKTRQGVAVSGRQSNYGDYHLPAGVSVMKTAPLYQAVVFWGWQLGRPFIRDELAGAYYINVSRAGDVMSYIPPCALRPDSESSALRSGAGRGSDALPAAYRVAAARDASGEELAWCEARMAWCLRRARSALSGVEPPGLPACTGEAP